MDKLLTRRLLAAAISLTIFGNSLQLHAEVCCGQATVIAFFNGVLTSKKDAQKTLNELEAIHGDTDANGWTIQYELMYNRTNGFEDFVETFKQRMNQQNGILAGRFELFFLTLRGSSDGTWFTAIKNALGAPAQGLISSLMDTIRADVLGKLLSLFRNPPTAADSAQHRARIDQWIAGHNKLLFVAHSQGNLFAVPAYDYAVSKTKQSAVKVVHIAPASPTLRGPHILADLDLVINGLRLAGGNVASVTNLIPGYAERPAGVNKQKDVLGHGMLEIYINQQLEISKAVKNEIDTALAELIPPDQ